MKGNDIKYRRPVPQQSLFFKLVALLARCQLRYLARNVTNIKPILIGFVVLEGIVAIGTIFLFPESGLAPGASTSLLQVAVICVAMGLICATMIGLDCVHPPAAATALMGAMGYLDSIPHIVGLLAAVFFLVLEAFVFNRILGGLPYPVWAPDPNVVNQYGALAGLPVEKSSIWSQFADKVFERRLGKEK